jgi:hypothetical protein|tara:strand:- start:4507 stop:4908 length:402 start_codon:yes stop_codon:yes gene_type:complete
MKHFIIAAVITAVSIISWVSWSSRDGASEYAPTAFEAGSIATADLAHAEVMSDLQEQHFMSEQEREQTQEQRRAALPIFLKAADEGIALLQQEIAVAKAQGALAADILEKEERLLRMQDALELVLVRNTDIQN